MKLFLNNEKKPQIDGLVRKPIFWGGVNPTQIRSITGKVCGCCTLLTFVRFYLVLYLADFSGDIMFCERDLVRERDLGHAEAS